MRLSAALLLLVVHSLCLTAINAAQGKSKSMDGCPDKCGNVTIPFPFGVGQKCSANSSSFYTVICNDTFNPPKPFLSSIDSEIVSISSGYINEVQVMQAVSPLINCSSVETRMPLGKSPLGKSLVGSPFTFSSSYNRLIVLGCKSEVLLKDSRTNSASAWCSSICENTDAKLGCNGINCCQMTIPSRLKEVTISYRTSEQGTDGPCGFAFLADSFWFRSFYKNFTSFWNHSTPLDMPLQYVPVTLEWQFDISKKIPRGVKCETLRYMSYADDIYNATRCYCDLGFEGNPYLPGGCQALDDNSKKKSAIIGISSGTGAILLLSGAWMSSKVIRKRIKANRKKKFFKRNGGLLLEQQLSSINDGGVDKIKLFNSKELALATDRYNEDRVLGRGGQGTVYKGMLPDGRIVAVKKSKKVDEADTGVFINEVVILSQINHRNVVKLLGCCLETEVPLLVYEFIPNGTLFQHIHDPNGEFLLSWKMRVRIATEVAGALSYMHYAASVPIYHRDIKSTNILLDDKYRAKVSDFGTSRSMAIDQTHQTTRVLGTFGYLDPEYFQSSQFTEKSDVYSFGVVMVELLTGEKAISAVRAEGGKSLATHFLDSMEEDHLFDILDPEVLKEGPTEEIVAVAKLAMRCLNLNGKRRPTMKEVAVELEGIQMTKEGPVLQSNVEDADFQSIEISEVYDFPSISDSTNMDVVTAESSESPLLFGNS